MALRPGQLIGDVSAYSGLASPVDVMACGPAALVKWDLQHLREFTASRPELRANFLRIVSADLAAKLQDMMVSSFSGEKIASAPPPSGAYWLATSLYLSGPLLGKHEFSGHPQHLNLP